MSEALIFASTNPQYDDIFNELQVQYIKVASSEHAKNMLWTCCVHKLFWMSETISVHNMFFTDLSLEFWFIELVIKWKIFHDIVD